MRVSDGYAVKVMAEMAKRMLAAMDGPAGPQKERNGQEVSMWHDIYKGNHEPAIRALADEAIAYNRPVIVTRLGIASDPNGTSFALGLSFRVLKD